MTLTTDRRYLIVVSASRKELSSFRITREGLTLVNSLSTGDDTPVSVTSRDNRVYVLNVGDDGDISTFRISDAGRLRPNTRSTSNPALSPAAPRSARSVAPHLTLFSPAPRNLP